MKSIRLVVLAIAVTLLCVASLRVTASSDDDPAKRVKIVGAGLELIEVTPTAEKCGKQKGETIRLRVTSESPIDVRMYMKIAGGHWINKDFANQKKSDEISSYRCDTKPDYKIYSHAAGSTQAWPNP